MKNPTKRKVIFHGVFKERYLPEIDIYADSMFNLCSLLFKEILPQLLQEKFTLVLEDECGVTTELFDTEQALLETQKKVHIIPNPDGAIWWWVPYLIVTIISVGVSLLLSPKMDVGDNNTASGANWDTVENVTGQGGVVPVVLGSRAVGSRVVSHGIDSVLYESKGKKYYTNTRGG